MRRIAQAIEKKNPAGPRRTFSRISPAILQAGACGSRIASRTFEGNGKENRMNWKLFFQAMAASAIAGCANAASQSLTASIASGGKTPWKAIGNTALLGATLGALTFAAQQQPPEIPAAEQ
jgi:hypothetical protein